MIKLFRRRISLGFSLIEILVTTGIITLILSMALVSYSRITRRQRFDQAAKNFHEKLRLVRDQAMSAEKPQACIDNGEELAGYAFELEQGSCSFRFQNQEAFLFVVKVPLE